VESKDTSESGDPGDSKDPKEGDAGASQEKSVEVGRDPVAGAGIEVGADRDLGGVPSSIPKQKARVAGVSQDMSGLGTASPLSQQDDVLKALVSRVEALEKASFREGGDAYKTATRLLSNISGLTVEFNVSLSALAKLAARTPLARELFLLRQHPIAGTGEILLLFVMLLLFTV
jgi:hypothetical protein